MRCDKEKKKSDKAHHGTELQDNPGELGKMASLSEKRQDTRTCAFQRAQKRKQSYKAVR